MRRAWLDLGEFRTLIDPWIHSHQRWHDHGGGLLLTIAEAQGIEFERHSTRLMSSWGEWRQKCAGYDLLAMNARSYTYPFAKRAAQVFKMVNPEAKVVVGGMHATVAPHEMAAVEEFDVIVKGAGEQVFCDVVTDPGSFKRITAGQGAESMDDWPQINRRLWPEPVSRQGAWPLEDECGWGPGPVATIITSRVCPWQCAFCNDASYIANMGRRSVAGIIDELNRLDEEHGPLGSVVFHDSMFFQQPKWLEEWLEKYPRRARSVWPYWAAARSDTVRRWPDLFSALVRETNWHTVSIGFESGSDRVLKILNKECTVEDNEFAIDLLAKLGDEMEAEGKLPPKFFANIMLAIPGETQEDALATVEMLKRMKRVLPSISYYAPYPGSALGYQLIAEGKSLMSSENYHRYPNDRKVAGIDYDWYDNLMAGPIRDYVRAQGGNGVVKQAGGVLVNA